MQGHVYTSTLQGHVYTSTLQEHVYTSTLQEHVYTSTLQLFSVCCYRDIVHYNIYILIYVWQTLLSVIWQWVDTECSAIVNICI